MTARLVHAAILPPMLLLACGDSPAREKTLMHCFYFTPVAEASAADWDAFYEETDELPDKIDELLRVWAGRLRSRAPVADQVKLGRTYGACFEFEDEAALQIYAEHPAHDAWVKAYEKVRVRGTTTFDIVGR